MEASYNFIIICLSYNPFILAMICAFFPALACLISRSINVSNFKRSLWGAIVTSKNFNLGNEITQEKSEAFKTFINSSFNDIPWLKDAIHLPIVGIGGTIRMISKIYRNLIGDNFKLQPQYTLTCENFQTVYDVLAPLSLQDRLDIKGIIKERADIVLGC